MTPDDMRRVVFDDAAVRVLHGDAVVQEVRWCDVEEISVLTSDTGPIGDDLCLLLVGRGDTRCEVPSESEGFEALLDRVFQIPEFDHLKFGEACRSADSAIFVCWRLTRRRWPWRSCIGGSFGAATVWSAILLVGSLVVIALAVAGLVELVRVLV